MTVTACSHPRPGLLRPGLALFLLLAPAAAFARGPSAAEADRLVEEFAAAVEKVNRDHAGSPGKNREDDLGKMLPSGARKVLRRLLDMDDGPEKWKALADYARAAAELDLEEDLADVEKELEKEAPDAAKELGTFVSRERFLLHARGFDREFATAFADVFAGVLETYDRTFGFAEFSKVPGKKIRVLLHAEERPGPPHFAPQYPYHSAIDFPLPASEKEFRSPTPDGKFLFYGLCHELGHLIAMWGDRRNEEDHHAWAHYTGLAIVDASEKAPFAKDLRDRRWRSLGKEKEEKRATKPSLASRDGVLALLFALDDLVGPARIGEALNRMDETGAGHRINRVRYYSMKDFEAALLSVAKSAGDRKRIEELFAAAAE